MPKLSNFRVTKAAVDALPTDRDAVYFDTRLSGFGIRTKVGGKKTYILQYLNRDGRQRRFSIGQHGALTAEEARDEAQRLLGRIAVGHDPAREREDERNADSISDLWAWYSAAVELGLKDPRRAVIRGRGGMPKRASSYKSDRSMWKRHLLPLLGYHRITELTRRDVAKFVNDVTVGKTARTEKTKRHGKARVTGGAGVAARALGLLGSMMTYAISIGLIDLSPCLGVRRPATQRRKVRLNPGQYMALGEALRQAEDEGEAWQGLEAIWVIALTGCRKSEVAQLRPEEVDIPGCALRLTETKTGDSLRPLGAAARKVLRPRLGNHVYVFYGVKDEASYFKGLPAVWKRVMARVDNRVRMPHLTLHGLRHAFASQASDLGIGIPTIKELLGHAQDSDVTAGYVHSLDEMLIAKADKVAGATGRLKAIRVGSDNEPIDPISVIAGSGKAFRLGVSGLRNNEQAAAVDRTDDLSVEHGMEHPSRTADPAL